MITACFGIKFTLNVAEEVYNIKNQNYMYIFLSENFISY